MKGTSVKQATRRRPVLSLALGFGVSALVVYAVVHAVGGAVLGGARSQQWISQHMVATAAAAVLALLALVDTGVLGLRTPMWRRQTPKQLFNRYGPGKAALLWGLDTGLVFTTYRVTSLSWAALAITALGLVPWWSGLLYALGFVLPVLVLVLAVPRRPDGEQQTPEPGWLLDVVSAGERWIRWVATGGLAGTAILLVLAP